MKITRVHIGSFGALSDLSIDFSGQMNVILGPNESGKSTFFAALEAGFILPSAPKTKQHKEFVRRYLPLQGGDTIDISIDFAADSGKYTLRKQWGSGGEASLLLPGGGRLTGDQAVEEKLLGLFGFGFGTLRNVFMVRQSSLSRTLETLGGEEGRHTLHDLGDLLQSGILEADGISVTRFQELLESRHGEYLSNWDMRRNTPAEKKGPSADRWSRNKGKILEAYYELQDRKQEKRSIEEQEERLGELLGREKELGRELSAAERFLSDHRCAFEDADRRGALEARLEASGEKRKELNGAYSRWLTGIGKLEELNKQYASAGERKDEAEKLLDEANRRRLKISGRKRYLRVLELKNRCASFIETRAEIPPITRADLKTATDAERRRDLCRGKLDGGTVRMVLTPRTAMELRADTGGETGARTIHGVPGETVRLTAEGRLAVDHEDWKIEVTAGEEDPEALQRELETAEETRRHILEKAGLPDIDSAEQAVREAEELDGRIRSVEGALAEELQDTPFETLETEFGSDEEWEKGIEYEAAEKKYAQAREDFEAVRRNAEYLKRDLDSLSEKYGTPDKLQEELTVRMGEEKSLQDEILQLAELPAGYTSAEDFKRDYRKTQEDRNNLREEWVRVTTEIGELEKNGPEVTVEQAGEAVRMQEAEFEKVRAEGAAVDTIRNRTVNILDEISRNPYGGLTERVSDYLAELTGQRYSAAAGSIGIPEVCLDAEETPFDFSFLSAGTKDVFALAVRLGMADFFQAGGNRFFVLDDPFVDLDPGRQTAAAALLRRFSSRSQCILFTCHPAHSELFDTARVVTL